MRLIFVTDVTMMTGREPDLSKMWVFGSECYAYKHDHKKLDPRCEKGIFVGYSRNSPAYLVYNPQTEKVSKHRLVKFIKKNSVEQQTQTDEYDSEIQGYRGRKSGKEDSAEKPQSEDSTENQTLNENEENVSTDVSQHDETTENVVLDTCPYTHVYPWTFIQTYILMSAGRLGKTFNQSKTAVTSNVELVT